MEIDSSFLFSFVTPFVKGRVFLNKNRLKNSQSLYKCASINSNGSLTIHVCENKTIRFD